LRLHLAAAGPLRYEVDAYDGHPRLGASVTAVAPEFAALLLPLPGAHVEPGVEFARSAAGLALTVRWPARTDRILWPADGQREPRLLDE